MKQRILILGAGYGGMMTALRLAKKSNRQQVHIQLVNASPVFVERIRNHQLAVNQDLKVRRIPDLLQGTGVEFIEARVTAIRPKEKLVLIERNNTSQTLAYDKLVYALGSIVDKDTVPGIREYAYTLDKDSSQALAQALPDVVTSKGRAVIIGGGLTGIEIATELAETYPLLDVKLITGGVLGEGVSEKGRTYLREVFAKLDITRLENTPVDAIHEDAVVTSAGDAIDYDVCIWAGGFKALPLAKDAGLAVNAIGQLLIDAEMHSISDADIYGVGDAATFIPEVGFDIRMACATAMPMGVHAADNLAAWLAAKPENPFRFAYVLQCISLGRDEGLVQMVQKDDTPKEQIITGKTGAWIKEQICRYTIFALHTTRRLGFYKYPQSEPQTQPPKRQHAKA